MTYDILTGYNVWHWSEVFNWSKISVESGVTFYNLSNLGKYGVQSPPKINLSPQHST